ncbi:MAG: NAD(P)H-hydrate epimerase, partial [Halobacteriales archaeon]
MISSRRMAAVDRNAAARGVPEAKLMENAGAGVARVVRQRHPDASVVCVAGTGSNGGDALVAARFLDATAVLLGRPESVSSDAADDNWRALEASHAITSCVRDSRGVRDALEGYEVVVDGVLGT